LVDGDFCIYNQIEKQLTFKKQLIFYYRDIIIKYMYLKGLIIMENRNCKKCGAVFQYITGYPLCKDCKEKDEEEFKNVKEYIREHPGVKIEDVAKTMNISPQQVLRYLRDERLEIFSQSDKYILCELCGCMIKTGRFCERCKGNINEELKIGNSSKLGEVYYYSEDEEKRIIKLKNKK